jgi:hypothetical protein
LLRRRRCHFGENNENENGGDSTHARMVSPSQGSMLAERMQPL